MPATGDKATPKVSVLMPVYNVEPFLDESIQSILDQTFSDFELVILDDASTDGSLALANKYKAKDSRIRILQNSENMREANCRNRLMDAARADLVAWMDADDFSMPNRLALQYDFLQKYPEVDIVGSDAAHYRDTFSGTPIAHSNTPVTDVVIKTQILFMPPMANPTAMIRTRKVKAHKIRYDNEYCYAPDYRFWVDCAAHCTFGNLPDTLLRYRLHAGQTTERLGSLQREHHIKIALDQLADFGIKASAEDIGLCLGWADGGFDYDALARTHQNLFLPLLKARDVYGYERLNKFSLLAMLARAVYYDYRRENLPAIDRFWRTVFDSEVWNLKEKSYLSSIRDLRPRIGLAGIWVFGKQYGIVRFTTFVAKILVRNLLRGARKQV